MNIFSSFPSKWLREADLGGDTTLTISSVTIELINEDDDGPKPVVHFEEYDKGLVLNKTNATTIANVLRSPDTDDWVGKQITLFPTQTDFGGKQVPAIRVRLRTAPRQDAPPRPAADPDAPVELSGPAKDVQVRLAALGWKFKDEAVRAVLGLTEVNPATVNVAVDGWIAGHRGASPEVLIQQITELRATFARRDAATDI